MLRQARDAGRPYHVVHFDGHGLYAQVKDRKSVLDLLRGLTPLLLAGPDSGAHGYLVFENPKLDDNADLARFAATLEKVCIDTVEAGFMTKDLALLVGADQRWLSTTGFLDTVGENLTKEMA